MTRSSFARTGLSLALAGVLGGCQLTLETVVRDGGHDAITVGDGSARTDVDDVSDVPVADASDAIDVRMPDVPVVVDAVDAPMVEVIFDDPVSVEVVAIDVQSGETSSGEGGPIEAGTSDGSMGDGCNGMPCLPDVQCVPAMVRCGVGACMRVVQTTCADGGTSACIPGSPTEEVCNGIDDDCNGMVDDVPPIPCGIGACRTTPQQACVNGAPAACVPGLPMQEFCGDGIDNNCNGLIDENCPCDEYVTPTGSGSRNPFPSITAALAALPASGGIHRICVAANSASSNGCAPATYTESPNMVDGAVVLGGFNPNTWTRDPVGCPVTIQATLANGVYFGHQVTRTAQLDGFTVRGLSTSAGSASTSAIFIQAGGVISNCTIIAGAAPIAYGINANNPAGLIPRDNPLIILNHVRGADVGTTTSVGIFVSNLAAEISSNFALGSAPTMGGSTTAIELSDAQNSHVVDNASIQGSLGPTTTGVYLTGNVSGVVVARNTSIAATLGGTPAAGSMPVSRGIWALTCTAGVAWITNNPQIVGGVVVGANPPAFGESYGVDVTGCAALIDSNAIVGRATQGGSGAAVRCSAGATACSVRSNTRLEGVNPAGQGTTQGIGVAVGLSAGGAVRDNRGVVGCNAGSTNAQCTGIVIDSATGRVRVEANVVGHNTSATGGAGISVRNTPADVVNNLVRLSNGWGIMLDVSSGPQQQATVHSNTVIAEGSYNGTSLLVSANETNTVPPTGVWINNAAICLGSGTAIAFAESGANATPAVLLNNDLYGCPTLYRDAMLGGQTDINVINASNDIPMNGGNLSQPPGFVSAADFHLLPMSMLIDRGNPQSAPAGDLDRHLRPFGPGYDIGCEEFVGP